MAYAYRYNVVCLLVFSRVNAKSTENKKEASNLPRKAQSKAMDDVSILLMDLDGCLYPADNGYTSRIHSNIYSYMIRKSGPKWDDVVDLDSAREAWTPIFEKYNLTKRGLMAEGWEFDPVEYDTFIRKGAEDYIGEKWRGARRRAYVQPYVTSLLRKQKSVSFSPANY